MVAANQRYRVGIYSLGWDSVIAPDASAGLERITSIDLLALAAWGESNVSSLYCVAELVAIGRGDHIASIYANRSTQLHILTMCRNHRASICPAKRIVGEQPVHT